MTTNPGVLIAQPGQVAARASAIDQTVMRIGTDATGELCAVAITAAQILVTANMSPDGRVTVDVRRVSVSGVIGPDDDGNLLARVRYRPDRDRVQVKRRFTAKV